MQRCILGASIVLANLLNIKMDGIRLATIPCMLTSHIVALIAFAVPRTFINDFEQQPKIY